jgi:aldehyde:ferredoxin oxidoreductase
MSLTAERPLERRGGYNGRIGHVDLTDGSTWYDEREPDWYRRYGGGGAIGAYYLLREIPAGADPLGPDNVLVFASSIVGGIDAPGVSRHTVLAKSPLSGGAGESQSTGTFGPALKRSGLDAIVVHGAAGEPTYLAVRAGEIVIGSAKAVWGLETADAHDALLELEGESVHTALIGPAGENLVRFASIVNDVAFMNCRTGMGAVMGSKLLKGIVVVPGEPMAIADPEALAAVAADYRANRRSAQNNAEQEDAGSMHWFGAMDLAEPVRGSANGMPMPSRNWQRDVFIDASAVDTDVLERRFKVDEEPPPNLEHHRRYLVPDGRFASDPRYGGFEPESSVGLALSCELADPEGLVKAIELTYRHGMDAESLGNVIGWAMEATERGVLAGGGFDDALEFGDADAFLDLAERIGRREGLGDVLAEGVVKAAERIGGGAEFAMALRGTELSGHDPRTRPGWALANASGPIGPDFLAIEHDWDFSSAVAGSGVELAIEQSRPIGIYARIDEADVGPAKVRQVVQLQDWWGGALESLMFDYRAIAPARYMSPDDVAATVRAATGWDVSIHEILLIGARRVNLLQEFNRKHGLRSEDERFPDRIHDAPIVEGPAAGAALSLDQLETMRRWYFAMRGWDESGRPTAAQLHLLDLGWVVEER